MFRFLTTLIFFYATMAIACEEGSFKGHDFAGDNKEIILLDKNMGDILERYSEQSTKTIESKDISLTLFEDKKGSDKKAILGPIKLMTLCQDIVNDNILPKRTLDSMKVPDKLIGNDIGMTLSLNTCIKTVFENYEIDLNYSNYLVTELVGPKKDGRYPQEFMDIRDLELTFLKRGNGEEGEGYFVLEYRDASAKRKTLVDLQEDYHKMIDAAKFYDSKARDIEETTLGASYGKRFTHELDNSGHYKLTYKSAIGASTDREVYLDAAVKAEASYFDERLNFYAEYEKRFSTGENDRRKWNVGAEGCFKDKKFCTKIGVGDYDDKYTKGIKDDDLIFTLGISTTFKF